jgi:hypothetical protein
MQATTSNSTDLPPLPTSRADRLRPVRIFRPEEAKFLPAAQNALELIPTLRGQRAVDCASLDALRPQLHSVNNNNPYEISIPREKLAASAPEWTPQAVRNARQLRAFAGSRKKEPLAENHRLFWRRQRYTEAHFRAFAA